MTARLDPATFFRPIAHRGLHDAARGIIENTASAFAAAITHGFGIECDLQPGPGGLPLVFHDVSLDRLMRRRGLLRDLTREELEILRYPGTADRILTFAEMLSLVAGRAPVLAEIKSDWGPPDTPFLDAIAALADRYDGPLALMSFDPAILEALRIKTPHVPRGLVATRFRDDDPLAARLGRDRLDQLSNLADLEAVGAAFIAYDIGALPTPASTRARKEHGLGLFAWTVRDELGLAHAARWSDAPIFEADAARLLRAGRDEITGVGDPA